MDQKFTDHWQGIAGFMRHRKKLSVALGMLGAAVLLLGGAVMAGRYPILIVNGTMITAARFEKNYRAASIYYENMKKSTADNASATVKIRDLSPTDLEVGVLNQMVVATLVADGAKREVGSGLTAMVAEKIGKYVSDPKIGQSITTLYGMSIADFRDEVLVPQAERDILVGRLYLRNADADAWLADARKSASVRIFSPKFRWDGEKVVAQ